MCVFICLVCKSEFRIFIRTLRLCDKWWTFCSEDLFDWIFFYTVSVSLELYVLMYWFFVGGHNNTIPLEAYIEGISTYRSGLVSYYV
jgi:hypothetical protein